MAALVTADLHLSEKQRDSYRFAAMERLAGLIEKHKPQELIILGDLTENKDYHPATLVNDVVDVIYSLSCMVDALYIPSGNHDYTQSDTPFFHFLRRFSKIKWINKVRLEELSIGRCLFLPHTRDYEKDWVTLATSSKHQPSWIFAHNTFEGAVTEHGKRLSGIPTEIFPKGIPVVSGDIHTPQTLGPVTYVGSPYTIDFGDDFEPRVLLLAKTRKESIPLPGPQKRLIELSAGYNLNKVKANPGDIVKARYKLKLEEQDKWFAIRDRIKRELLARELIVHLIQPVTTAKTRSVQIKRPDNKSDERIVQEFGQQRKLTKARLQVGMDLLEKA